MFEDMTEDNEEAVVATLGSGLLFVATVLLSPDAAAATGVNSMNPCVSNIKRNGSITESYTFKCNKGGPS